MAVLSSFDVWLWPMVVLVVIVWVRGGFTGRAFLVVATLIVAVNDGLVGRTLKRVADRPRPHQALNDVRQVDLAKARPRFLAFAKPLKVKMSRSALEDVDGRSLPSSHTINSVSVALVCATIFRRRGWLALLPAVLVAYSRIYTGAHWPSDIAISIFIGLGSTLLLLALAELTWRRSFPRVAAEYRERHPTLFTA